MAERRNENENQKGCILQNEQHGNGNEGLKF